MTPQQGRRTTNGLSSGNKNGVYRLMLRVKVSSPINGQNARKYVYIKPFYYDMSK